MGGAAGRNPLPVVVPCHRLIASGGSAEFYRTFPFDISPTRDDRPFFYYMYKPADFLRLLTFP